MKLDKRACRHAANAPLNISLNAGVLYTERVNALSRPPSSCSAGIGRWRFTSMNVNG